MCSDTIYRVRTNGEDQSVIISGSDKYPRNLQVYEDWLYFMLEEQIPLGDDIVELGYAMRKIGSIETDGTDRRDI